MSKNILSLSAVAAKEFFLQQNNYCSIPLPLYFKFDNLLQAVNEKLQGKTHADFQGRTKLDEIKKVNSIIYHSKDGKYQWRPLQILHPVLYVELVNLVCESKNWDFIRKRFKQFSANPHIKCASIPLVNQPKKTMTAASVLNWWQEIEQSLLSQSLEYSYIVTTDITDFYPSIYTHTIPWALYTKPKAQKKEKGWEHLFGNRIDSLIQSMQHRQTNGIPQGSVLMDFFAEMVLGYADEVLTQRLSKVQISKYLIFRYRDDYKILVSNPKDGEIILKHLTEVLLGLNLKLNTSKTVISEDIISGVLKKDKLFWIQQSNFMELVTPSDKCKLKNREWKFSNQQKTLLGIYQFSKHFPNSGTVAHLLSIYSKKLQLTNRENIKVLVNILTSIMISNPKSYPQESALLSKLLSKIKSKNERLKLLKNIKEKLEEKPHTDLLDIWFQRISWKMSKTEPYETRLCEVVQNPTIQLWDNQWLSPSMQKVFADNPIVDRKKLNRMNASIPEKEVDLFLPFGYSYW